MNSPLLGLLPRGMRRSLTRAAVRHAFSEFALLDKETPEGARKRDEVRAALQATVLEHFSPIGLELGQFFARIGTDVLLVNRSPLLSRVDPDLCGEYARALESDQLEESIAHVDIAYSTRIQEERFGTQEEADSYRGRFRLNQSIYTKSCEPNTVIMHPLPRDSRANANELDADLNDNPNLAIFRQTDNGVLVRMALFALILDVVERVDESASDVRWYTGSRF